MRITFVGSVVAALVVSVAARGQEKAENPFKDAKVGDYVTYKMAVSIRGMDVEASLKEIVTAKDDKELTLTRVTTPKGKDEVKVHQKIDLTKPHDAVAFFFRGEEELGKFEKATEGKETIKVGEKSYDCTWIAGKVTSPIGEDEGGEASLKVWFSKSVPLTGLVKVELKGKNVRTLIEFTGSGHEK